MSQQHKTELIENIWQKMPVQWVDALIYSIYIYNKGNKTEYHNYRGLTIQDVA